MSQASVGVLVRLYNTASRELEPLVPITPGEFRMYICGPTVYDYAHVGHARAYVAFDVLKRTLEQTGLRVVHAQNFTDIEESIGKRAAAAGVAPLEYAERYAKAFLEDMATLHVKPADAYPRASAYVPAMVEIVQDLLDAGAAYPVDCREASEGNATVTVCDIYFSAEKNPHFGQLIGRPLTDLTVDRPQMGDRKSALDFALWKSHDDWGITFPSPFGRGRPGWHIECVAMATGTLGQPFDLHGGGLDLVFPHHESEAAIAETWQRKPYVRHWMHNGFVLVDGEKMSKSLGNFRTIRDFVAESGPEVARTLLVGTHYRDALAIGPDALGRARAVVQASNEVARLLTAAGAPTAVRAQTLPPLRLSSSTEARDVEPAPWRTLRREFWDCMADDLHTERAMIIVRKALEAGRHASAEHAGVAWATLAEMGRVLGILWSFAEPAEPARR
ncbi:MAG: cysteine--tRNA ligase [Thermoplasmatota archaeon]